MNVALLRVLRVVIRADSDPARQALFANLMQARLLVHILFSFHARVEGTRLSACLIAAYGAASANRVTYPSQARPILAYGGHANARRQVARIVACLGDLGCGWITPSPGAGGARRLLQAARSPWWRRLVPLLRRLDRRHGFLVACRASVGIAWYAAALSELQRRRPKAVLVSSDSNPEEMGLLGAARLLGVPRVFVSHAYPTPLSPPLDFTLSILEGNAAVRARRERGPITGDILLAGVEGESGPLDVGRFSREAPVIGIFTPKAVSWPTLAAIIDDCRRHFQPRRIVLRWHPSMMEEPRLAHLLHDRSGLIESARGLPLEDVARQCDWVIADENSNVHLPVLKLGIPTIAVRHLGIYPESRADQYGFVAHGVILPPLHSVTEITPERMAGFFTEAWRERFAEYDASYLKSPAAMTGAIRAAIETVAR